ncbi:MAG: sodium:proline symporter [Betaproteobacteria bacterium]
MPSHVLLLASLISGFVAATVSTVAQIALWLAFTASFPGILWRDARLAAAIVLGPEVLASTGASVGIMAVATVAHLILSLIYAAIFCLVASCLGWCASPLVGALLGAALYAINMYGFTLVFPWFTASRDWITLAAHIVFGASATVSGEWVFRRLSATGRLRNRPATRQSEGAAR